MRDYYDVVKQIHSDNVAVGAEVITTFNYIVTPLWLESSGVDLKELEPLVKLAVQAATEVRDEWAGKGRKVRVAGCLPPLGPSYDAAEVLSYEDSVDAYSKIASCMVGSVDLYLMETMPSIKVANAALAALNRVAPTAPRWLAFTLQNELPLLMSDETIQEVANAFQAAPVQVQGMLFNCAPPEVCLSALDVLAAQNFSGLIGVYPNCFEARHSYGPGDESHAEREELTPARFAALALEFQAKGAQVIGGCCGCGPQHLAAMVSAVSKHDAQPTAALVSAL